MSESVELFSAYLWTCPGCGNRMFGEPLPLNIEQKEMAYRAINEMEHWQELPDGWDEDPELDDFTMAPSTVVCSKCGELYTVQTESHGMIIDDDSDDPYYD